MTDGAQTTAAFDAKRFREVLGHYPTGVCAITSRDADGTPIAMVVGTFTSVSLDPPLVGFLPAHSSTTWPVIQASGRFCVNIIAADQEDLCRRIAMKADDRFDDLAPDGPAGAPRLNGAVAWIDCTLADVHPAGDHAFVMGAVIAMETPGEPAPLIFYRGGYGGFSTRTLFAAEVAHSVSRGLRLSTHARATIDAAARDIGGQILLSTVMEDDVVFVALGDGRPAGREGPQIQLGQQVRYMPPSGAVFAAWSDAAHQEDWLKATGSAQLRDQMAEALSNVRARGVSFALASEAQHDYVAALDAAARNPAEPSGPLTATLGQLRFDPPGALSAFWQEVRQCSVPVFDANGQGVFALTAFNYAAPRDLSGFRLLIESLKTHAADLSRILRAL